MLSQAMFRPPPGLSHNCFCVRPAQEMEYALGPLGMTPSFLDIGRALACYSLLCLVTVASETRRLSSHTCSFVFERV